MHRVLLRLTEKETLIESERCSHGNDYANVKQRANQPETHTPEEI
jgi:hypothetical protein